MVTRIATSVANSFAFAASTEYGRPASRNRAAASTNARAILRFTVNGEEMGQTVASAAPPVLRVSGATPTEILELHVVKNNATVFEAKPGGRVVDVTWKDPDFTADAFYYIRVKLKAPAAAEDFLNGKPDYIWSSPVWVTRG